LSREILIGLDMVIKGRYIYAIRLENGWTKIGYTKHGAERLLCLVPQMPLPTVGARLFVATGGLDENGPRKVELLVHDLFREKRMNGEWFNLSDEDFQWFMQKKIILKGIILSEVEIHEKQAKDKDSMDARQRTSGRRGGLLTLRRFGKKHFSKASLARRCFGGGRPRKHAGV
jgi:hypothetical protein